MSYKKAMYVYSSYQKATPRTKIRGSAFRCCRLRVLLCKTPGGTLVHKS